jgi:hypothetical protein
LKGFRARIPRVSPGASTQNVKVSSVGRPYRANSQKAVTPQPRSERSCPQLPQRRAFDHRDWIQLEDTVPPAYRRGSCSAYWHFHG